MNMIPKNTICLWFNKDAEDAANFYAATFPDSEVTNVFHAPSDFPGGKTGDVLTVEFTVCGIPCIGLNGGPVFKQSEAFSFQIKIKILQHEGGFSGAPKAADPNHPLLPFDLIKQKAREITAG